MYAWQWVLPWEVSTVRTTVVWIAPFEVVDTGVVLAPPLELAEAVPAALVYVLAPLEIGAPVST